jgi:NADH:ubiquinone oxidoreductase subunit E
MKHKQRKRKAKLAKEHAARQAERKRAAIIEVTEELQRSKKQISMKRMADLMQVRGYVPNGRGGWRPLHTINQPDTISKA